MLEPASMVATTSSCRCHEITPSYVANIIAPSEKVTAEKDACDSGCRKYIIPAQHGVAAGMRTTGAGILGPVPRAYQSMLQHKYQSPATPPTEDIKPNFRTPPHRN